MPRPQVYDRDAMLDAAEELAVEGGVKAVTIRAVSDLAGVSNGAIYHAFGSRGGLVDGRGYARLDGSWPCNVRPSMPNSRHLQSAE